MKQTDQSSAHDLATVCVLCSHNCGLRVDVEDNTIVAVRADASNPISHGYVCNKAYSIDRYVKHPQRVTTPLRKRPDGSFEAVSWEVAIAAIGAKLRAIRDRHGPRAIGLVGVGGQGNHLDAPYALGWTRGVGTRRWFNAYAQEKTQHQLMDQWMFAASPATFLHADEANSDYMLVIGTNPKVSNRGHNATDTLKGFKRDEARTLVVVDPRVTETARSADVHLRVKPGNDCYLLLGLCAQIVRAELCDDAFLRAHCSDSEALLARLRQIDVAAMATRSGVEHEALVAVAEGFARARRASILNDLGVEQTPFSTLNAYLIRVLLVLTGNLAQAGGNRFIESINPPDARGLDESDTERALMSGIQAIRALGSYAMFSPSLLPEEVLNDHPERIRAVVVEGANPLLSFSDTQRWREAFAELELSVVIDPAMTETARLADWVLPTPVGYEKWEISAFPKHFPEIHMQLRPPLVEGPQDALVEAEIYARLARAMDLFGPTPRALKLLARFADKPRGRHALTLAALAAAVVDGKRRGGGVQSRVIYYLYETLGPHLESPALVAVWLLCVRNALGRRAAVLRTLGQGYRFAAPMALAEELWQRVLAHPEGVEIARLDEAANLRDNIGFSDGKIRVAPAAMLKEIERALDAAPVTSSDYPLVLAAGLRTHWTANTIHRDPGWRKGRGPHCPLSLHPDDALALGVREGELVVLETPRGRAELPATLDARLPTGMVAVPNGFGALTADGSIDGVNLNELTAADDRDPFTGCPHHKTVACRVARTTSPFHHRPHPDRP